MMLYLRRVSNLQGVDEERKRERERERSERKWEKRINWVAGS